MFSNNNNTSSIIKLLNNIANGDFEVVESKESDLTFESRIEGREFDVSGSIIRREKFDEDLETHAQGGGFQVTYSRYTRGEDDRYMQYLGHPRVKVIERNKFFEKLISANIALNANVAEVEELKSSLTNS